MPRMPDPMHVAEIVFDLFQRRRRGEHERGAFAIDCDFEGVARALADDALHVLEIVDRPCRQWQTTRSPVWNPAAAAGLSGCTASTRALIVCLPYSPKIVAKMTIAKTKFAIGPATTMAARLGTGWKKKLCLRSSSAHGSPGAEYPGRFRRSRRRRIYVAAERNGGDFPARAVTIVKADDFRAKTDGKHQNSDAAQPGDQEMAKLVEEHHKAEDEQERDEIGGNAAPQRMQMRQQIRPHNACLTPPVCPVPNP